MGKGALLIWYLCTTRESLHMLFIKMWLSGGTGYVSFALFLGILMGPGEGRGGAPGTVPLQNAKVTSQKACLRNAECGDPRFESRVVRCWIWTTS